jgi:NADH:ubiquinone oxidoreductase subunit 6 (subunit J)
LKEIELTMPDFAFTALAVIAVASALLALESKEIVYGAISLAVMLVSMAGFFILLDAPFVAMFQIIVYVGAVAVLILFTVMLVRREKWVKAELGGMRNVGILGALTVAFVFGLILIQSTFGSILASTEIIPYTHIGIEIVSDYWPALLVIALLLSASLMGALTLAKVENEV